MFTLWTALVSFALITNKAKCDILVYQALTNQIIEEFHDLPASFGPSLPTSGLKVFAVLADPSDGCSRIAPPPNLTMSRGGSTRWCAIVARLNCTFELKVRNAQASGYDAVIVHNVGSNELERMSANNDVGITIPSLFVGETTGRILIYNYQYNEDFALLLNDGLPFNINTHLLLPFTVVVGLCFVTMIVFTVVRCCRERRRMQRYRLPNSVLKKIPTLRFVKGVHQYDTCAICLEDYVDGEKLRVLPCAHAYHCKCIDPWLTKNRRVCPMCKRKVFVRGEKRAPRRRRRASSDTASSSDADDTTPLLSAHASEADQRDHGTFPQNDGGDGEAAASSVASSTQEVNSSAGGRWNFHGVSEDEEMLDASVTDDERLEDAADAASAAAPISRWQRFKNFFQRRALPASLSTIEEGAAPTHEQHVVPALFGAPSSNNILNANLAGSFGGTTTTIASEETDDEQNILTASASARPHSSPNLRSVVTSGDGGEGPSGDQPRASSSGRIGVAAIPNATFNPTPPISRGSSHFIV